MDQDRLLARWMAGEIDDAEFRRHVSPHDYAAYVKLRKAIELYAHSRTDIPGEVYQNIRTRISASRRRKKRKNIFKIAIPVAALLLVFLAIARLWTPSVFSAQTAYGKVRKLQLPDGSSVWLGARSKLVYNPRKWSAERSVFLSGTAYFEVKKGGRFSVITPNGKVSVLGTRFEVKSIDDYFKTVCFEGKVSVETLHRNFILQAGQSVQKYNRQVWRQTVDYKHPDLSVATTRFNRTPLAFVLKELENQYHIRFINRGVDTRMPFTGSVPHHDLKTALELVSKALSFKYKQIDKQRIIIKPE